MSSPIGSSTAIRERNIEVLRSFSSLPARILVTEFKNDVASLEFLLQFLVERRGSADIGSGSYHFEGVLDERTYLLYAKYEFGWSNLFLDGIDEKYHVLLVLLQAGHYSSEIEAVDYSFGESDKDLISEACQLGASHTAVKELIRLGCAVSLRDCYAMTAHKMKLSFEAAEGKLKTYVFEADS